MLLTRSTYHRVCARLRHTAILVCVQLRHAVILACALAALVLGAAVNATGAAGAATLVIDGAGDGHGVGMSQDGALGFAEHGWSYPAILAHYYTGTALGQAPPQKVVKVLVGSKVKAVPLETYVRGVVSAEMPSSWPMAALEAQAVASRTYALTSDAGGAKFDVYSDDRSQMYLGKAAETSRTNSAVAATAGQIVTYDGQPAITYFFASSGGHTENVQDAFAGAAAEPWLVGVDDPYDEGPLHRWTQTIGFASAAARLGRLVDGSFEGIEVLQRGSSPRIVTADVLGSKGRTLVSGAELEERLGLYSTWAYFGVKTAKGTRPEPDASGPSVPAPTPAPAPTPTPAPAPVTGSGGASPTPVAQPARVTGAGGVTAR
jgi:SpoIID/LytB domain protein